MPSSSKLDYLSKYTSGGSDDKKSKKKKKKSKKKEVKEVKLHDSSDEDVALKRGRNSEDGEYGRPIGGDEDEGPVVVDSVEAGIVQPVKSSSSAAGNWQTVPIGTSSNTSAAVKQRHDSSDEDENRPPPRRRYDSSEDEDNGKSPPRQRRRHDSDAISDGSAQPQRCQRYDSDDSDSEKKHPDTVRSSRRRHDSDSDGSNQPEPTRSSSATGKRRRYDSDSDRDQRLEPTRSSSKRQRHDSDDDDSSTNSRERMSLGHKAGLQGYRDFNKSEKKIQQRKHKDAQLMVDKYGMGETVYRDKHGRRSQKEKDAAPAEDPEEQQRRLNQGRVQREALEAKAQEMATLQQSTFARHQDDDHLEELRKNEIRADDPMAQYAVKKQAKTKPKIGKPSKPMYKGPPPKPNRYGIRPGYRWDGIDRGNGFEDKILAQKYNQQHKAERAYRWRSSDM